MKNRIFIKHIINCNNHLEMGNTQPYTPVGTSIYDEETTTTKPAPNKTTIKKHIPSHDMTIITEINNMIKHLNTINIKTNYQNAQILAIEAFLQKIKQLNIDNWSLTDEKLNIYYEKNNMHIYFHETTFVIRLNKEKLIDINLLDKKLFDNNFFDYEKWFNILFPSVSIIN